ncbi:hypothetical protein [Methylorubrum extorquens]
MASAIGLTGLMLTLIAGVMSYIEFKRDDPKEGMVFAALSAVGFFMLMGGAALKGKPAVAATPTVQTQPDPRGTSSQQALFVVRGQEAVQAKLRDPASATFRGQFFSYSGNMHVTCGWVNSKNGFGGYVGFQRYISSTLPETTFLEQEVRDGQFDLVWQQLCRG